MNIIGQKITEIDRDTHDKEIRAINDKLAKLGLKQREDFNKSVESACKAYLTF